MKTTYHRHGLEIHIEITDGDRVISHYCIANATEHEGEKGAEFIVRACNSHDDGIPQTE